MEVLLVTTAQSSYAPKKLGREWQNISDVVKVESPREST